MSDSPREIRTHAEPLTLWKRADVRTIIDRGALRAEIRAGRLARLIVDKQIAKVLPADRRVTVERIDEEIVRVVTSAYHRFTDQPTFALAAVLEPFHGACTAGAGRAPQRAAVVARLLELVDTPYLYGGTSATGSCRQQQALTRLGVFEAADFEHPELARIARSQGVDCSGLLNAATGGFFAGDSKDVHVLGPLVSIANDASPERIAHALEPLDVVVWKGHMVIALGDGRIVQSVGDGDNASAFFAECGGAASAWERYNRVAIDDAVAILGALMRRLGKRPSATWPADDHGFVIVRTGGTFAP